MLGPVKLLNVCSRYEKWMERSKTSQLGEDDDKDQRREQQKLPANHPAMRKAQNVVPKHKKGPRSEIKRPEQILKKRREDEKKASRKGMKKGKGGKKVSAGRR